MGNEKYRMMDWTYMLEVRLKQFPFVKSMNIEKFIFLLKMIFVAAVHFVSASILSQRESLFACFEISLTFRQKLHKILHKVELKLEHARRMFDYIESYN